MEYNVRASDAGICSLGTFISRKLGSQSVLQVRRVGSWAVAGMGALRTVVLRWPFNVRLDGLSEHEIRGAEVTPELWKKIIITSECRQTYTDIRLTRARERVCQV